MCDKHTHKFWKQSKYVSIMIHTNPKVYWKFLLKNEADLFNWLEKYPNYIIRWIRDLKYTQMSCLCEKAGNF